MTEGFNTVENAYVPVGELLAVEGFDETSSNCAPCRRALLNEALAEEERTKPAGGRPLELKAWTRPTLAGGVAPARSCRPATDES